MSPPRLLGNLARQSDFLFVEDRRGQDQSRSIGLEAKNVARAQGPQNRQ